MARKSDVNQPEYKTQETIENEALGLLHHYKPEYATNLTVGVDTYDFITKFMPAHIMKTSRESITVEFLSFAADAQDIAGYSTYKGMVLNKDLFDSDNVIETKSFNWTAIHESYHSLFHRSYLLMGKTSPLLPGLEQSNKIITLKRDLGTSTVGNKANPFCVQANMFAAYWLIPRTRMKAAIKTAFNKDFIEYDGDRAGEKEKVMRNVADGVSRYFDLNKQPLTIALNRYEMVRDINKKGPTLW